MRVLLFRWAVDVGAWDHGMARRSDLEAEGWERAGSHPFHPSSHLLFRAVADDDAAAS